MSHPSLSPNGLSPSLAIPESQDRSSTTATIGDVNPANVTTPLTPDNACFSEVSPVPLEWLAREARELAQDSRARSTRRAYRSDWARFTTWCVARGVANLPASPTTLALYLTEHAATRKVSTLQRWMASIGQAHHAAGHEDPTKSPAARAVWRGIRRVRGIAQQGKAPVLIAHLRRMAALLPATLQGCRDRALILLGFAGAFRRSELVGLDVADLELAGDGLVVTVRRSKTDQEAKGRKVGIPFGSRVETCPVRAVQRWLEVAAIQGPVFRPVNRHGRVCGGRLSGDAVAQIVKRLVSVVGLDPARYGGHSLRAGLVTSAAAAGVEERAIAEQTGHRSLTVLRRYIRAGSLFLNNAAAAVGL